MKKRQLKSECHFSLGARHLSAALQGWALQLTAAGSSQGWGGMGLGAMQGPFCLRDCLLSSSSVEDVAVS